MKLFKSTLILIIVPIICSVLCLSAFAEDIELDKKGSIAVSLSSDGNAVSGGNVTVYHIATLAHSDEGYVFSMTDSFKNSNILLDTITSRETAKEFFKYAVDNGIDGITESVDGNGNAAFDELELGLYLMAQNEAAEGFEEFEPFIITVPMNSDGSYVYDVDASPKIDIERDESDTESSAPESAPPDIPQTGMLKWPVPVLAICGLLMFSFGWALCFRRKKS